MLKVKTVLRFAESEIYEEDEVMRERIEELVISLVD